MRGELHDRFGEYPEEVEHLFRLIEIKIKISAMGFMKLELSGDMLALHFPPPEEIMFYEGDDAPFQKMMGHLHELKPFHAHLKQDGKQLTLNARMKRSQDQKERLNQLQEFLHQLATKSSP